MQSPIDHLSFPTDPDELLRTARADAAAGCWSDLRDLVAPHERECHVRPELVVFWAEAEMRLGIEYMTPGEPLRRAVNLLGAALFELGEIVEAEKQFWRVVELGRAAGDLVRVARAANNLGAITNLRGRHELALTLYDLAMSIYEGQRLTTVGAETYIAETYHNMAVTYRDLRDFNQAEECELRALAFANQADEPSLKQMAQVGLAELALLRGNASAAADQAMRAAEQSASAVDLIGEADALRIVGEAHAALGAKRDALQVFDRAVALIRQQGCRLVEAEALQARAAVCRSLHMLDQANEDESEAEEIFRKIGMAA